MEKSRNSFVSGVLDERKDTKNCQKEKEAILCELKKRGGRITNQRKILLDIILEEPCSCCKEIYYKAIKKDPAIGIATVYRMVSSLEEIGAISRKKMYEVQYGNDFSAKKNPMPMDSHGFFQKMLTDAGVDPKRAEKEACKLEHSLSAESFCKLKVYMEKEKRGKKK